MLATRFYDFIFQDPDIAGTSYELVEERLSRSLAGGYRYPDLRKRGSAGAGGAAVSDRQHSFAHRHPGRGGTARRAPAKAGLIENIRDSQSRETGIAAIHYAIMAINMAVEMMCHAYTCRTIGRRKMKKLFVCIA
jgi:diguanylate cyclase